jgi:hypothetical protein
MEAQPRELLAARERELAGRAELKVERKRELQLATVRASHGFCRLPIKSSVPTSDLRPERPDHLELTEEHRQDHRIEGLVKYRH